MDPNMFHLDPPFPEILYEFVSDPSTDSIISWSESGKSFIVWNESEFCVDVLPRCFHLRRFSSFINMLDRFSIRKVEESDHQLEFANDSLVRGNPREVGQLCEDDATRITGWVRVLERMKKRLLEKKEKMNMKKRKEQVQVQLESLIL